MAFYIVLILIKQKNYLMPAVQYTHFGYDIAHLG